MRRQHTTEETEPREPEVTAGEVIAYLATLPHPASIRQIAHGMELKHSGRRFLPRVIQQLKRRGDIEETYGGRFRLAEQKSAPKPASRRAARAAETTAASSGAPAAGSPPKRARDPNLIAGRIVAHRDGYGFVVPDHPIPRVDGDLFIGRDNLGDAMNGDHVLARIERRRADGRAEGRVVQIVEREHLSIVGLFRYGPHGNNVLPYDTRIPQEVSIPPGDELTPELRQKLGAAPGRPIATGRARLPELDGAVVNVEITRFPNGGLAPTGRVVEILGRPGDIGVDVEIIIRKHHLPLVFDSEVLVQARATQQQVAETDLRGRRDFRDLPIVTIDGETARDFDDAVYVRPLPNGHFELQVHIADVAHYVRRESALDREARLRGTSVYFPNRAVPMLPEELSNGICSLNPQEDRLVMSAIMEMDATGKMVGADFAPGVIRSAERMTYTNVNNVLEGDPEMNRALRAAGRRISPHEGARAASESAAPRPRLDRFRSARADDRIRRIRTHAKHRPQRAQYRAPPDRGIHARGQRSRRAISRAARHRFAASRSRKARSEKVLEFEELAQAFGYSLGVDDLAERRVAVRHGRVRPQARGGGHGPGRGRMRPMSVTLPAADEVDIRPQHYQRLTEKIAGKPEERILSYLMLRSLKQARYAADLLGHFALATKEYTHFTSPIRRYPDLIVHRALKWALENPGVAPVRAPNPNARPGKEETVAMLGPYRRVELAATASESSEAERRAEAAERELMEWKTAQFMESHLGEEYDALIISVQKFGFFVELTEIFVEGLVSIDRLEESTGQRCVFRERDHTIVTEPHRGTRGGSSAKTIFRLGDRVRVRAERIDPFRHRVEFSLI